MPGSGKTTVGEILSRDLSVPLVDTDDEIVKAHGEINKIFADFGEQYFRDLETEECKKLSLKDAVISTGGGTLIREENREILKATGKIVYLRTKVETIEKRLSGDDTRPLLKTGSVQDLFSRRRGIYEGAADITVDTDDLSPEEIARRIEEAVS